MVMKSVKSQKPTGEWKGIHLPERAYDGKLRYYYQPAEDDVKIVAIFENSTHLEYLAKRPVVGETGVNLYRLLKYITILDSSLAQEYRGKLNKLKICIVNAMNIYGDVNGLSEEAKRHLVASNFPALRKAVEGKKLILVFGKTADLAYDLLSDTGNVNGAFAVSVYHLSPRALRGLDCEKIQQYLRGKKSVLLEDGDNTQISLALKFIAEYICKTYDQMAKKRDRVSFKKFADFLKEPVWKD